MQSSNLLLLGLGIAVVAANVALDDVAPMIAGVFARLQTRERQGHARSACPATGGAAHGA